MEHPGLHIGIFLFFDESFVEETRAAVENVAVDFYFGIAGESEAPDDVSSHPTVAVTLLPPTPAAIGVLKIVKAVKTGSHDVSVFLQVLFPVRMRCGGGVGLDSAENAAHDVLW